MNRVRMALALIALSLPLTGLAKGGAHFNGGYGRSPSFSRGFSSPGKAAHPATPGSRGSFGTFSSGRPVQAPTHDVPSGASPAKPSFGTFGSARDAGSAASPGETRSKSAVTRGLDKNAAQSNALKTLDQRTNRQTQANPSPAPAGAAPGAGNAPPVAAQPGGLPNYSPPPAPGGYPNYPTTNFPQPQPPVAYPNSGSSGGFLSGLLGYMLGRSIGNPPHNTVPMDNGSFGRPATNGTGTANVPVPPQSGGGSFWRIFLWLVLLSAIGWIIWYFAVRKKPDTPKKSNYSL